MTFTCAITHQKHLAQSGRSTRSTVDFFNTLRVFTREPIKEQEIGVYEFTAFNPTRISEGGIGSCHKNFCIKILWEHHFYVLLFLA